MTDNERRGIVDTLHQMELRMSERLVRVETELREWRKESDRLRNADAELTRTVTEFKAEFEVDRQVCRDRSNRMLVGLAVVAVLAVGELGSKMVPLF